MQLSEMGDDIHWLIKITIRNAATYDEVGVTTQNIEKVNYIYEANGWGKTTISNFFGSAEENQFSDCKVEWKNNVSEKVFVLTHNVYFHKELSFIGNGNNPNKNIHYWILRKKNYITNIQYYEFR